MSVHYKRKMHGTNYSKKKFHIKEISCVLILLKYELYEIFYTEIFQIYGKTKIIQITVCGKVWQVGIVCDSPN